MPLKALLVLEAFEVEGEDVRQFLDFHPDQREKKVSFIMQSFPREEAHLFSASCRPQHLSQENLFRWHNISLALNCRRQAVTEEFGSISIERSKNSSSREVTWSASKVSTPERGCLVEEDHSRFRKKGIEFRSSRRLRIIDGPTSWVSCDSILSKYLQESS